MGRFNFSNMQNKKDTPADNSFIPVEFRDAVVEVSTQPTVSAAIQPKEADPEKETFAAGGFIDETGNWNDGSGIFPKKTSDEEWNSSIAGQIVNSNAYKKYFYNREEVLKEAQTMSKSLKIPENVILKDADSLAETREIYNFQQKQMDKDEVFEAYPELGKIAAKSESDAAIALHNLQNVKETKGIVEAAKAGWEMFELSSERGRLGYAALNGAALDDKQIARIAEIDKRMKEMPKIPGLLDSPMEAIVGGSVQTGGLMVRGLFSGQKMGAYGAGFGALLGAIGGGTTTLGVGAVPGAIAGARVGYSIGTRIGAAEDMYHEIVGNNYLNFKKYKGEDGKQLLTENEARTYAAAAAAIETGIEFSNVDKVLGVVKGAVNEKGIKAIVAAAKDNSELRSMLTAYVKNGIKNIGEVAATESAEEGVQEASNRIISNIMAANHIGGDIPEYSFEDIIGGALEASWEALPASIGLGAAAHGAGSIDMARRAAAVFSLRDEKHKADYKNMVGIDMLRKLRDYFANNEFVKKNPDLAQDVLEEQLTDSGLENVSVDTDMVLNQEGGYELLKDVAAKAGIDEEQFNLIVEERMDMQIPTAVYAQQVMTSEAGEKLENYITFDSMGACLARSRQYAARVRKELDEIMSLDSKRREEALNNFLDSNFKDDKEREVAEAVLRRFPDNPAAGVQELRKQLEAKIDAMLEPCLDTMRQGMGNGTAVIFTDDNHQPTTQENAAGGYRVSNNDMWYSKWYKDYGRAPSKKEMRDIAIENLIGESKYTVPGYEYQPGMEQFYEDNKAQLAAIEESLERLNALAPRLEKINPGDLTITEGLSAEGFEVYKDVLSKLQQGPSKQAGMAARMNAILFARMADRMAELHKAMGQKKYTALDFYNSVQLDATGNAGVGVGLNQAVNVERDFEQKYEPVDLNPLIKNMIKEQTGKDVSDEDLIAAVKALKGSGETEEENQSAINYINEILRSSDPVTTDDLLAVFDFSKMTDYDAQHVVMAKSQSSRKNKLSRSVRNIVINKPSTLLKQAVLVEVQETNHSDGYYNANHKDEALYNSYRFVIPVKMGSEFFALVVTAVGTNENILQSLNEVKLYEIFAKKIPPSQRLASLKDDGIGNDSNESIPSMFSLSELLFKVKGLNGESYVNQETGKLNIADKFVISRKDASGTDNTLEQRAYHGSPAAFNRFDVGFIGSAAGTNTHGWGLYFAKNKKAADGYKKALGKDAAASIYEVDVPENKELLDEDKPFAQQLKGIQKRVLEALNGLTDEQKQVFWDNVLLHKLERSKDTKAANAAYNESRRVYDAIDKLGSNTKLVFVLRGIENTLKNAGYSVEQIEAMKNSEELRKQEMAKYAPAVEDAKAALEAVEAEDARLHDDTIKQAIENPAAIMDNSITGQRIYYGLSKALSNGNKEVSGDRLASEYLNEHGIKGIAYNNGPDGRCFVVFDDKAVSIIERYNQSAGTMAITANTQLLEQAKNMEATGAGREEIYKATGWHKGVDGMWRFEIPDNIEKIELSKMPEPGEYVKLADIYDNPMLYAAYPMLRDISIGTEDLEPTHYGYTTNGKFVLNTKFLAKYKNSVDKIKKTLDAMKGDFSKNLEKDVAKEARDIVNKIAETPENISENELRKISSLVSEDYYNYYIKPLDFDSVLFGEVSTVSEQEKNEAVYEDLINSIESYKKEKNEAQKAVAETFFHELQHIIQKEEGFASGGNYRDVRKQIDATLAAYDDEIKKMSPEAKQYYATYQSYNDVKMKYVFGQVSENRVKEIEGILREYESKVPESERNRIIRIQGMRYQLLRHKENKMLSDFEAYKNLAGEQEARAASKKAELYTKIATAEAGYEDIYKNLEDEIAAEHRELAEEYVALYSEYKEKAVFSSEMSEAEQDANIERKTEIETELLEDAGFKKMLDAFWEKETALENVEELKKQYDDAVLNGVNEMDAIVVFNGVEVASMSAASSTLKGQTIIKGNGQRVIALFAAADQSTFMHEAAHLYLTELMALANMPNAPKQLLKDVETIKSWGEWQDGMMSEYKDTHLEDGFAILDKAIREAAVNGSAEYNGMQLDLETLKNIWLQERFARGFENYLKQGKAPTSALRQVFYRFKNWLCSIYKDFRKLGGAPSREVSAVMDRMIATQDEIDIELKKRGVNDFVKHGGLDYLADDSQALYNRMIERAREEAEANVLKVALKDVREDFAKQQEELYKQVEDDYRKQLEKEPVFIIQQHLANHAGLEVSAMCEALGVSEEEYNKQIEEYGGSLDAAVDKFMDEFKADVESQPTTDAEFREMAEEKVQEDYYRKMVTALELNAFENIAAAQRKIVSKLAKALKEEPSQDVAKAMKALTSKEKAEVGLRAVRDAAEGHYRDYVNYVKSKLETMPLSDANNYRMWRRKSSQAQQQADMAMSKGEWEKAVNFKKQQLVYDLFADEAVKSRKYTEKLEQSLLRKQATMNKNNKIPADERYVFNHLLYAFGFTNKDAAVPPEYSGFTDTFMKRDETLECPFVNENGTLNLPDWILSAGTGTEQRKGKHYDLTMDQLKDLAQLLKVIYKTGMESDKLRTAKDIHGNSVGLLDAIGQIAREAAERVLPKNNRDMTGAEGMTTLEKALFAANAAHVSLLKPETILRQMGPAAMRYIYEPLKAAADKELKLSEEMQKELNALFGEYSKKELYEMRTKAKYKFGTSNITKERLIMIGLNWGTYINMKRVMDGFDISSYEVNEALSNLDKRDWKFIEGIWALYEKHWPEVQAVEARITGAVLEKQEPMPFDILGKDGIKHHMDGGYFPLKYDPTKDTTVAERAEDAAKQAGMAGFALGIGRSMTKERSMGTVTLPILLDFDVISKTLTDEIHLISFREPVRDVRRIILNDEFREVVKRLFGINTEGMLRQWSADCWALEPKAQSGYERVMSMIRANSTMAVLGYRTMTAVLNVLNIAPMAHYLGGPAEAMRAMKRFYAHPKEQYEYIVQQSVFMAERAQTMDVNIREAVKRGTTADVIPGYKVVQDNAFKIIAMTDLSIAMPLWLHEYEKAYQAAMDNGLKPESAKRDAIMAGDAAVRRVFGSSQKIDLSAVQRGSEVMKMLTMYYSYFSTLYNALSYAFFQTRQQVMRAKIESGSWKKAVAANKKKLVKGLAPLAYGYLMWVLIPSLLDTLFRTAADDDDDKWAIEKLVKKTGKNILSNTVGGIPILRDAIPFLTAKAFDEPQYGMGSLPAYGTVEQLNRVINSIESDKKTKYDVARETLRLGGTAVGFSQTLSDGLVTTVEWVGTGFEHSLAEYLKAVLLDKRLEKK